MIIAEIKNITKNFVTPSEKIMVLAGIDLVINSGEVVTISGASGCGKSTLLNIIGGLDRADSGSVLSDNRDIESFSSDQLADYRSRRTGFIFQFHYLLRDLNAEENVMLPAYMGGMSRGSALAKARQLLDAVGLSARCKHYAAQLSGGERQRVAVARSLINDPPLILADEPTGNLDEHSSEQVAALLFSMVREQQKSLLLVSHAADLVAAGDRCFKLHNGLLEQL